MEECEEHVEEREEREEKRESMRVTRIGRRQMSLDSKRCTRALLAQRMSVLLTVEWNSRYQE